MFSVLDAIMPPRVTQRRVAVLSSEVLREIIRREKNLAYAPKIRSLLPYRNRAVKALVYEMKYRNSARAYQLAAELLHEELLAVSEDTVGTPLVVPVPMHAQRKRERGFNQTEMLCEKVLGIGNQDMTTLAHYSLGGIGRSSEQRSDLGFEYAPHALIRIASGIPQQKLTRNARLENMKGSMRADPIVKDRICIVVDDVTTTGATLTECQRALKAAGAKGVYLLALAG